jgi:hypothetical protein
MGCDRGDLDLPALPGEDTMLNDGDFFYTEEEWAAIEGI